MTSSDTLTTGMQPNMEEWEAMALESARLTEHPWLERQVEFMATREKPTQAVPKTL
jgi:hypothetical protein